MPAPAVGVLVHNVSLPCRRASRHPPRHSADQTHRHGQRCGGEKSRAIYGCRWAPDRRSAEFCGVVGTPARLILGGPMMGTPLPHRTPIVKGASGILAFDAAERPCRKPAPASAAAVAPKPPARWGCCRWKWRRTSAPTVSRAPNGTGSRTASPAVAYCPSVPRTFRWCGTSATPRGEMSCQSAQQASASGGSPRGAHRPRNREKAEVAARRARRADRAKGRGRSGGKRAGDRVMNEISTAVAPPPLPRPAPSAPWHQSSDGMGDGPPSAWPRCSASGSMAGRRLSVAVHGRLHRRRRAFCLRLMGRRPGPTLLDGSAVLTGWLLAVSLPPLGTLVDRCLRWCLCRGLRQQVFGGLGQNPSTRPWWPARL